MSNRNVRVIYLFLIAAVLSMLVLWRSSIIRFVLDFTGFFIQQDDAFRPYERSSSSVEFGIVDLPGEHTILVELARTQQEQIKGLSGHAPLSDQEGMLFINEQKIQQRFWMKEMLFPIDIIWIDDETIIGFIEDARPENPVATIYVSPKPVDRVLEVQAGFVRKYNLKTGDQLDIELSAQ